MLRHCARVYLAEARRRRDRDPAYAATLLQWAKNTRNRSNAIKPVQPEMFGGRANPPRDQAARKAGVMQRCKAAPSLSIDQPALF